MVLGTGAMYHGFGWSRATRPALICACLLAVLWTSQRIEVWRNPVTLWADNAEKSPNKARVHSNLGKAYLDAGDYEKAWQAFSRARDQDPTLLVAWNGQASALIEGGSDYTEARRLLDQLLTRSPTYVPALINRGVVKLRMAQPAAAVIFFRQAIELEPTSAHGPFNLAGALISLGRYSEAEAILRPAILAWPKEGRFHALLGLLYVETGDVRLAQRHLNRAIELDPASQMAHTGLQSLRAR